MRPLLDSQALIQALQETKDLNGPGVLWLRDLYRSQRLCSCCGKPFFAHNQRSTVCGNTCVVKPAEQTPGIAKVMHDILLEAGCPREACVFLPGPGETVGARLVRDPRTALIAFTGSKAVGLDIIQRIEANLLMRNYAGFLSGDGKGGARIKSRRS